MLAELLLRQSARGPRSSNTMAGTGGALVERKNVAHGKF